MTRRVSSPSCHRKIGLSVHTPTITPPCEITGGLVRCETILAVLCDRSHMGNGSGSIKVKERWFRALNSREKSQLPLTLAREYLDQLAQSFVSEGEHFDRADVPNTKQGVATL